MKNNRRPIRKPDTARYRAEEFSQLLTRNISLIIDMLDEDTLVSEPAKKKLQTRIKKFKENHTVEEEE